MAKISDNLLAAFIDGKTSPAETRAVLNAAASDPKLQETIRLIGLVQADMYKAQSERLQLRPVEMLACCGRAHMPSENVRAFRPKENEIRAFHQKVEIEKSEKNNIDNDFSSNKLDKFLK